jgi:arylsulfatase A-like enzyme
MLDLPPTALDIAGATGVLHQNVVQAGVWLDMFRAYCACLAHFDHNLGRLLDALDAGPHAENTIIVLCSDHGLHTGQKQHWGKFTLWQESCHIPLLIAGPGIGYGQVTDPVGMVDVYPTLLELAGFPQGAFDGVSLAPLLRGEALGERVIKTFYKGHVATTTRWLRQIKYKTGQVEAYNRLVDPGEWWNVGQQEIYLPMLSY